MPKVRPVAVAPTARTLLVGALLALLAYVALCAAPITTLVSGTEAAQAASYRLDSRERAILREVNRQRRRFGLPGLKSSTMLTRVAHNHTADQVRHNRIGHSSSDGTPFAKRIRRSLKARTFGEVIAYVPGRRSARSEARSVVRSWLRSPGHRAALLKRSFRRVGIGRGRTIHGSGAIATVDFASRDLRRRR